MTISTMQGWLALTILLCGCPSDIEPGIRNADPRAEITSHSDGDTPEAGFRTFSGTVDDPDHAVDDLVATWLYDGTEACPALSPDENGSTTCEVFLDSGERSVSLQVQDPLGGIGVAQLDLNVQPYGDPWAEISSPLAGNVYYSDQLVELAGVVGDDADAPADLEAWWESSLDGELNVNITPDTSGNVVGSEYLSEGDHQLLLKVRNTGGNEAYDAVTVSVGPPNSAPTCGIDAPPSGSEHEYGELITFEATVDDVDVPEDWLTATWSSHLVGELGVITPNSDGSVTLPLTDLSIGAHNVTLTVADEQGTSCTDSVVVTVNDCDILWYADDDGDGFGDPASTTTGCEQPTGYVDDDTDCDDRNGDVHPDATEVCNGVDDDCDYSLDDDDSSLDTSTASTWYADSDADLYGDAGSSTIACDQPSSFVADATDCDDADATAYPGAPELCDGADDDCDGTVDEDDALDASTWYADTDGDGYGDTGATTAACSVPSGYSADATDCDDGDATINPSADERCDSADNDCDGTVDEDDATDASTWYADADADGYGSSTSTIAACSAPTGYVSDATDCDDTRSSVSPAEDELCNGRDDDCDSDVDEDSAIDTSTWYQDRDSDGYGDDATTDRACSQPSGYVAYGGDCDDGDAAFNPGATESDCTDPADYNCDGSTAYSDSDGDGFAACEECDDTDAAVSPAGTELCDGIDNDCDGSVDEADAADAGAWYADADADGYGDGASTTTACSAPSGYVADATDCDDGDSGAFPGAPEYCDATDNDCDGTVDEASAVDASTWYADVDADGYGDITSTQDACTAPSGYVSDATDCDDDDAVANPGADEYCDGHDDDCDGDVDEDSAADATTWSLDADGDGFGGTLYDVTACTQPSGFVSDSSDCNDGIASIYPGAPEYCNGSDDDCDSVIDEDEAVDASTWYADSDSDGYGDAGATTTACSEPSGFVADATDCDDASSGVNPGEDEYCDGHDDDCDGDTDEDDAEDASTWYLDGDGDGYGLDSLTTAACSQPTGYAAYDGDCDDADTAYNPGATEDDCADPADYNCDGSTSYADVDGDGWAACEDCDDTDYNANPGADEYCDGHDDDCDGDVDESDSVDASSWYADSDGDGYGDSSSNTSACSAPTGYVADLSDCDDGDSGISPGAVESVADGVDQDCDGGDVCYEDLDGDAYGSTSIVTSTDLDCADGGESSLSSDCDDSEALANPAETEVCSDGIDNDCDGTPSGCEYDASSSLADADAQFTGQLMYAEAYVVAPAGDVNADGYDDFLVGAAGYWWTSSIYNFGAAYLVLGGTGLSGGSLSSADAKLTGVVAGEHAGYALAGVGDVNADGYDDFLVGAYTSSVSVYQGGTSYLVLGSSSPSGGSLSGADAEYYGDSNEGRSGEAVAGVGDFNGDSYDDFLIGSPYWEDSRGAKPGTAYLVLGERTPSSFSLSSADALFYGHTYDGRQAGYSVGGGGDIDGDGLSDALVGDDQKEESYLILGNSSPSDVDLSTADATYSGTGHAVAFVGDVNGDGNDDVMFGEPYYEVTGGASGSSEGVAWLVLGSSGPSDLSLTASDAAYYGTDRDEHAGWSVASAGDVDGDGFDDMVVGAPLDDSVSTNSGAAYIILGQPAPAGVDLSDADAKFLGEAYGDYAGFKVAGAGDVDGDGLDDFLMGALGYDSSAGSAAGSAYLMFGISE